MKWTELTDQYSKELTETELLSALKVHARNSHAIMKQSPLFAKAGRGEIMLVNPSAKHGKPTFWIDALVGEMSSWRKYPSRTSFIKGYTTMAAAGSDAFALIPLDGALIGVAPGSSFYRSFTDFQKSLKIEKVDNLALIEWIQTVYSGVSKLTGEDQELHPATSLAQFKRSCDKLDKILAESKSFLQSTLKKGDVQLTEQEQLLVRDLLSRHVVSTAQYLREKLDPEGNGFKTLRVESVYNLHGDHEVWTSSPSLLIKHEKYVELVKSGELS